MEGVAISTRLLAIEQVSQALQIIDNVGKISSTVCVNKNQCKRIADRFSVIGEGLKGSVAYKVLGGSGSSNKDYPGFDDLFRVLRKGEALVSVCTGFGLCFSPITSNPFQTIHEELDSTLDSQFHYDGDCVGFPSGIERSVMLTKDAERDGGEFWDVFMEFGEEKAIKFGEEIKNYVEPLYEEKFKKFWEPERMVEATDSRPGTTNVEEEIERSKSHRSELAHSLTTRLEEEIERSKYHWSELTHFSDSEGTTRLEEEIERSKYHWSELTHFSDSEGTTRLEEEIERSKYHWSELTRLEEKIEPSKVHWSELTDSDSEGDYAEAIAIENRQVFRTVQLHPRWGIFFGTFGFDTEEWQSRGELEVGEKFAEGAQAWLYHPHVTWKHEVDKEFYKGDQWVPKLFKNGTTLRDLQSQWPKGYFQFSPGDHDAVKVFKKGTTLRNLQSKWPQGYLQFSPGDYDAVIAGYRPTLPSDLYPSLKVLIEQCWHCDPNQRPDFSYIYEELQRIRQALDSLPEQAADWSKMLPGSTKMSGEVLSSIGVAGVDVCLETCDVLGNILKHSCDADLIENVDAAILVEQHSTNIFVEALMPAAVLGVDPSALSDDDEPPRKRIQTRNWDGEETRALLEVTEEAPRVNWFYICEKLWEQYGFDRAATSCQRRWDAVLKSFNAIRGRELTNDCVTDWETDEDERSNHWIPEFDMEWCGMIERILTKSFDMGTNSIQIDASDRSSSVHSELDEVDTDSDDEGLSGDSTSAIQELPRDKVSDEKSFSMISRFVNKQIEDAVQPLLSTLQRRVDDLKHREELLVLAEEKLAQKRKKMYSLAAL